MKRLVRKSELEDRSYDNDKLYDKCIDLCNIIKQQGTIIGKYGSFDDLENIIDCLNYVDDSLYDIHLNIDIAKDNGQENENNLGYGNEIIEDLNNEIEDLIDEKNELIYQLENTEAGKVKRLYKTSRYICHVHDDIMEICTTSRKEIQKFIRDISDSVDEEDETQFDDIRTEIEWSCDGFSNDIEEYIEEARDLNERMGNGLMRKNDSIVNLQNEIENLRNEIQSLQY